MAYPNTSAQDIAQLQRQIDVLRVLVKDSYVEAVIYVNMDHPVPQQEVGYLNRQLDLIRRAEEMMPELLEDEDDDGIPTEERVSTLEWARNEE
jgi:hypothetical protein